MTPTLHPREQNVMVMHRSNAYNNLILQSLSSDDLALISAYLEPISMPSGFAVDLAGEAINYIYFLEEGVAFTIGFSEPPHQIEVGIVGREGITGVALLLGSDRSPYATVMQVPGYGFRISVQHLAQATAVSPLVHARLIKFAHTFLIQVGGTAMATRLKLEHRLARWLVMVQDRHNETKIKLTHEFLALILGVRRPGVTVAMQVLEGKGYLRSARGQVHIINRRGLIDLAGFSYGVPEAEYQRVIGATLSRYVN